jgi:tetratricopeptide (TPR) repeat protein
MSFYKDLMKANAAAFWMMGVESFKKGNYDYALFYYTQAIALHNDEPLFYQSLAEAYEAKKEIVMAVDFYKTALDKYKEKKRAGPAKFAEYKIKMLQKSDNQNLVKKK